MKFSLMHPRNQLVNIMNRIYDGGMTTLSGGNLSIKDENNALLSVLVPILSRCMDNVGQFCKIVLQAKLILIYKGLRC